MHITILLTLSIPPGEAELPVCVRYDAHLHPEPPGPDTLVVVAKKNSDILIFWKIFKVKKTQMLSLVMSLFEP